MNNKSKYFLYARKSQDDNSRQILSLDSQEAELRAVAEREGYKIVDIYHESKTASKPDKRPLFLEMIKRIKNKEADGILCWKLDRLSRNPDEAGIIMGMLQRGEIQHIRTFEKNHYPNDNVVLTYVDFSIANQYSQDLTTNVLRGMKAKYKTGWYHSQAPLGYLNYTDPFTKVTSIVKDPQRFDTVKEIWRLMLTGNHTPAQILDIATNKLNLRTRPTKISSGKPMTRSNIYKLFSTPFYYGWYECKKGSGDWVKGNHDPIITEEEYNRVQKLLGVKGRQRPRTNQFAFTGLMRCGNCNALVTAETKVKNQQNGNVHTYVYYHCTKRKDVNCPERLVRLEELEKQIDDTIATLNISEKFKDWALRYLHEYRKTEANAHLTSLKTKQARLQTVDKQILGLTLRFTDPANEENKVLSNEAYQMAMSALKKEKTSLEVDLNAQGKAINEWVELSERTFNFARYARTWFIKGDLETKRAIFSCLGSHFWLKDQKVSIELHPVFQNIFENKDIAEREIQHVRTSEIAMNKALIKQIESKCPTWLGY